MMWTSTSTMDMDFAQGPAYRGGKTPKFLSPVAEPMVTTPATEAESESPSLIFLSNCPVCVKATVSWLHPKGDGPRAGKIDPQRVEIFWGISFLLLFFSGLGFVLRRNKGSKTSKQTISLCFFCLVVVVVAKGVDFLGGFYDKISVVYCEGQAWSDWIYDLRRWRLTWQWKWKIPPFLIGDTSSNGCFSLSC